MSSTSSSKPSVRRPQKGKKPGSVLDPLQEEDDDDAWWLRMLKDILEFLGILSFAAGVLSFVCFLVSAIFVGASDSAFFVSATLFPLLGLAAAIALGQLIYAMMVPLQKIYRANGPTFALLLVPVILGAATAYACFRVLPPLFASLSPGFFLAASVIGIALVTATVINVVLVAIAKCVEPRDPDSGPTRRQSAVDSGAVLGLPGGIKGCSHNRQRHQAAEESSLSGGSKQRRAAGPGSSASGARRGSGPGS